MNTLVDKETLRVEDVPIEGVFKILFEGKFLNAILAYNRAETHIWKEGEEMEAKAISIDEIIKSIYALRDFNKNADEIYFGDTGFNN
jgi:hypothetical protein